MENFSENPRCKHAGCTGVAGRKGSCTVHRKQMQRGHIPIPKWSEETKNPPCLFEGCPDLSHTRRKRGYCHTHYLQDREDVTLSSKREWNPRTGSCSEEGCCRAVQSRGLCSKHYSRERSAAIEPIYVTQECATHGCNRRTANQYCAPCLSLIKTWGFVPESKNDPRKDAVRAAKKESRRAEREARRPACQIEWCGEAVSSDRSPLCRKHRSDMSRKGCELGTYVALFSETHCKICGDETTLVTDHDHSHHPDDPRNEKMCTDCIRGRICTHCNTALGLFRDNPETMLAAANYISGFQRKW